MHNTILHKEFFAVRDGADFWPYNLDEFETIISKSFSCLETLSKRVLAILAVNLEIPPSIFLELCDFEANKGKQLSNSFMHVFKYHVNEDNNLRCIAHTDSGLVTLIPCYGASPGLELLDWRDSNFKSVESGRSFKYIAVLIGETLARLTCFHYQATVHKVVKVDKVRYSLPFQLRARVEAIIDSSKLSNIQPNIIVPSSMEKPITVKDFIK